MEIKTKKENKNPNAAQGFLNAPVLGERERQNERVILFNKTTHHN